MHMFSVVVFFLSFIHVFDIYSITGSMCSMLIQKMFKKY